MRGCEAYIQVKHLNTWRSIYSKDSTRYKIIVLHNNMILHPKPRDEIEIMTSPYTSLGKSYVIFCYFILNLLLIITF